MKRSGISLQLSALLLISCANAAPSRDEGIQRYDAGEYEKAIESFDQTIRRNPEDAEALYKRACCRMKLMERDGVKVEPARLALDDLDRAIELAPDEYRVYFARAMAYAAQSRFKEAAHDLLVCVQSQDKRVKQKAHLRLAQIYDEKFEEMQGAALRHYEAYIQMGGQETPVVLRHEELKKSELERAGRPDAEAAQVKMLESARHFSASGKHQEALDLLARILQEPLLAKDPLQQAKDLYIKERLAVEIERKADALFEAAAGMIHDGKFDAAQGCLQELLKKYPDTQAAKIRAPGALLEILNKDKK